MLIHAAPVHSILLLFKKKVFSLFSCWLLDATTNTFVLASLHTTVKISFGYYLPRNEIV